MTVTVGNQQGAEPINQPSQQCALAWVHAHRWVCQLPDAHVASRCIRECCNQQIPSKTRAHHGPRRRTAYCQANTSRRAAAAACACSCTSRSPCPWPSAPAASPASSPSRAPAARRVQTDTARAPAPSWLPAFPRRQNPPPHLLLPPPPHAA